MMFFVMIKPQPENDIFHNAGDVDATRSFLLKLKEEGIMHRAYTKLAGGYVYVINADSFADVRNAFRDSVIMLGWDCEIHEIDQKSILFLP
ncbi:hypothetical protein ACTHGU_07110 [Chitinophagaceae bacterium MMS25-I14]